ncbi:MAG: AAA family ATPase [Clostridium sp.]|jgi:hypothetical protein|nr:AAA family ATPase [Clostridium sp.]
MEIIRGKIKGAKKVCIYGPEGIGKSTFAAQFPDALFIDTEGSTKDLDVARFPVPSSWAMLLAEVSEVKKDTSLCKTLIIDTSDWAEMLCIEHICAKNQQSSVESFSYGKGYTYVQEEFGRLLNALNEIVSVGINVVLTAHAKMRKFEQPDEMGAYDRWELKMSKGVAPMIKEWSDMVLFANYKTIVSNVDGQGAQKGKNKAFGGQRVMYTSHHPCWDAKNRFGLPEEMPFDYSGISHIFNDASASYYSPQVSSTRQTEQVASAPATAQEPVTAPTQAKATPTQEPQVQTISKDTAVAQASHPQLYISDPNKIPKALRDLMEQNAVDECWIQSVVASKGYYPDGTMIENYDPDFIQGVLVGAWPQVYQMVLQAQSSEEIPFN